MRFSPVRSLLFLSIGVPAILGVSPSQALDWYRWRGPSLNGVSLETGWQTTWPADGPKQLWKASVGTGFSSVSVSNGHLYTVGNDGSKTDTVYCFDAATGAPIWKHPYPAPLDPMFYEGGPSGTPAVDGDRVYSLSRKGDLLCLDVADGHAVWTRNVHEDPGDPIPTWGFSGSPVVEGDLVILDTGSAGTALDKKTGKVVWASNKEASGYASPVPFSAGSDRLVAQNTLEAVKPANGATAWSYPWKTQYDVNAPDPIIFDGKLFVTSGYGHGCALLDISKGKPLLLWQNKSLCSKVSNAVLWKGYLFSSDEGGSLKCLSWETGEVKWSEKSFGSGAIIIADGKIIGLGEKGELIVANASPDGFKPTARAQVLGGKCWTTPVLSNGRVYCRNAAGNLVCLDVSGK